MFEMYDSTGFNSEDDENEMDHLPESSGSEADCR